MAGIACLYELALVGVGMAGRTSGERDACIARLVVSARGMALLARGIQVGSGQRVARLRVVETVLIDLCCFPVNGGVALEAVGSETALVLVFVAGNATWREAKPGAIQIFGRQQDTFRRCDVLRVVTGTATDAGVFAIEQISGPGVIESFWRWVPMNHCKVLSVMVGVALYASRSCGSILWKGGVEALVVLQFLRDFLVAFDTAKGRRRG